MKDAHLSDLLRQASIETDNRLMDFSDSSQQDFPDTGRIIGAYNIFNQCGPIDSDTHVPVPVSQSGVESEYNAACTAGMVLAHFGMLIHDFLNKDTVIVPDEAPLIILDIKSDVCMAKNFNDTKHTRHISRRVSFVMNGENCKMHKIDWY